MRLKLRQEDIPRGSGGEQAGPYSCMRASIGCTRWEEAWEYSRKFRSDWISKGWGQQSGKDRRKRRDLE
eukprot:10798-Amorphochlora_amoeboformis.AAC.1